MWRCLFWCGIVAFLCVEGKSKCFVICVIACNILYKKCMFFYTYVLILIINVTMNSAILAPSSFNLTKMELVSKSESIKISLLQSLIQYELIFRLLLKVTVDWSRECNLIEFME